MQKTLNFVKKTPPPWSTGSIDTPVGSVYRVSTDLTRQDIWGMIKSRMSAFRMNYSVTPGLYAVGEPTGDSDVLVTANYKLTFDTLRRALKGLNAWILVLDTRSINVWCAAGKGTFGTGELVARISETKLDSVVSHRRIILPQLGAVGVNAAAVQKQTGFRVRFGPVRADDIPAYVQGSYQKTPAMSAVQFPMIDRLILTPMEINPMMKKYPWYAAGVLLVFGLQPSGVLFQDAWSGGWPFLVLGLLMIFAGAFLTPVLLPFIPFRSFALKGWLMGIIAVVLVGPRIGVIDGNSTLLLGAALLLFPALCSYIALQFTGSTTYTGMSGVNRELKIGIPLYIAAAGLSSVLVIVYKLREWRIV
ncbi:MAG TPA: mercury methylation corrinoid protein HgcA [Nitrospirota bacterium]